MMNSSSPSSAFVCKRIGPGLLAPGMQAARRAPPFERVSHSWDKDGVGRVAGDPRERVDRVRRESKKKRSQDGDSQTKHGRRRGRGKKHHSPPPRVLYLTLCVSLENRRPTTWICNEFQLEATYEANDESVSICANGALVGIDSWYLEGKCVETC